MTMIYMLVSPAGFILKSTRNVEEPSFITNTARPDIMDESLKQIQSVLRVEPESATSQFGK